MTTTQKNERIRYARTLDTNIPKNCLFTITTPSDNHLVKEEVYFGISRCNLKEDICKKKLGRELAKENALRAEAYLKNVDVTFIIADKGRTGKCSRELLPLVLEYFYGLQ